MCQCVSHVKRDLSDIKRDLSHVKRDLSDIKRDLSDIKRDLLVRVGGWRSVSTPSFKTPMEVERRR